MEHYMDTDKHSLSHHSDESVESVLPSQAGRPIKTFVLKKSIYGTCLALVYSVCRYAAVVYRCVSK